jgi:cephalosporin hydroxylase
MRTLQEEYAHRLAEKSDINEHMPTLSVLAEQCRTVCEFGVRYGNSTIALLHGLNAGFRDANAQTALHSFDISPAQLVIPEAPGVDWTFTQTDTSKLQSIPRCDMLFIDTAHTFEQVRAELRHAHSVSRYLAFHDTTLFGWSDEFGGKGPGIMQAIFDFMATQEGRRWYVSAHYPNNNGLLILKAHQ